jgi:hypothetical protein
MWLEFLQPNERQPEVNAQVGTDERFLRTCEIRSEEVLQSEQMI